jgi:ATP-binding cassette subfamily F protein uup
LEYKKLETDITELELEVSKKTTLLNATVDHIELSKIAEEIETIQKLLDKKSERWMGLAEFII